MPAKVKLSPQCVCQPLFEDVHAAGGVVVLYVAQMANIERHIIIVLSDKDDRLAYGVCQADLVKDIRISACAVRDDRPCRHDRGPDIAHDRVGCEEVVAAGRTEAELAGTRSYVIFVYRLELGVEWHQHEQVCGF